MGNSFRKDISPDNLNEKKKYDLIFLNHVYKNIAFIEDNVYYITRNGDMQFDGKLYSNNVCIFDGIFILIENKIKLINGKLNIQNDKSHIFGNIDNDLFVGETNDGITHKIGVFNNNFLEGKIIYKNKIIFDGYYLNDIPVGKLNGIKYLNNEYYGVSSKEQTISNVSFNGFVIYSDGKKANGQFYDMINLKKGVYNISDDVYYEGSLDIENKMTNGLLFCKKYTQCKKYLANANVITINLDSCYPISLKISGLFHKQKDIILIEGDNLINIKGDINTLNYLMDTDNTTLNLMFELKNNIPNIDNKIFQNIVSNKINKSIFYNTNFDNKCKKELGFTDIHLFTINDIVK